MTQDTSQKKKTAKSTKKVKKAPYTKVDPGIIEAVREAEIDAEAEKFKARQYTRMVGHEEGDPNVDDNERGIKVTSTGHVTLYRTDTGRPAKILYDQVRAVMRKEYKEGPFKGQPVFVKSPAKNYIVRGIPCMLNPEYGDRDYIESLGLGDEFCPKTTIRSEVHRRIHMAHRHKVAWEAIRFDEERRAAEDKRVLDQAQLESLKHIARFTGVA